jgi:hypothetical protein
MTKKARRHTRSHIGTKARSEIRASVPFLFGFTVVEMLTTIAGLTVILGTMVSLARHVRTASATDLTKNILRSLDEAMSRYVARNSGLPPSLPTFISETTPHEPLDDAALARRALANNQAVVRLLKANRVFPADAFETLPISYYDVLTVRDAWGSPIVFMPTMDPAIGMAAKGWFFFSAGPDRRYVTKSDNLYSYELPGLDSSR